MCGKRIGELLRAAARERPADGVTHDGQHQPEGGGAWRFQRENGMRGEAGEEGARRFTSKRSPRDRGGRLQPDEAEANHHPVPRHVQERLQKLCGERCRCADIGLEELPVGARVPAQRVTRLLD